MRRQLATARAYADQLAAGGDPYRGVTGVLVKAYRADLDQTLQPYALDLPRGAPPAAGWPLLVSLHGAYSNHRLNLRRVFGYSNRPGESDEEASRNEVAFPEVPMIVVSPFGRGEFMGFQGLGERDVLQVIADVRRAYPRRSRSRLPDRPVDGRRGDLAHRAAPSRSVRGDRPGLRRHRRAPVDRRRRRRPSSIRRCWR